MIDALPRLVSSRPRSCDGTENTLSERHDYYSAIVITTKAKKLTLPHSQRYLIKSFGTLLRKDPIVTGGKLRNTKNTVIRF